MARFQVKLDDPLPLYAQLERTIKLAIVTGELKLGDRLPTIRQLAVELKINANTIAKVYAELERQGTLVTKRGVGTFVQSPVAASVPRAERAEMLRTMVERFLAEATSHGFTPPELTEQIQRFSITKGKSHARR